MPVINTVLLKTLVSVSTLGIFSIAFHTGVVAQKIYMKSRARQRSLSATEDTMPGAEMRIHERGLIRPNTGVDRWKRCGEEPTAIEPHLGFVPGVRWLGNESMCFGALGSLATKIQPGRQDVLKSATAAVGFFAAIPV